MSETNNVVLIKAFFESDGGRKVAMEELKKLTPAEWKELGTLILASQAVPAAIAA